MSGTLRFPLAALAILALASTGRIDAAPAPAPGANVALPYPSKVPLVLHINGVERAKDRLAKMIEALPPAEAKNITKELDAGFAHFLKGRKLDAVPKDGRIFAVVHDFAKLFEGEPAMSVLVPVTGYKDFKETFLTADERKTIEKAGNGIESVKSSAAGDEVTLYLVDQKSYVVLTPSKDTAEVYTGKFTPAQSSEMGAELSSSFLVADVSLFVNMDAINDLYGEQIRQFKGLIDFALGQAQNMGMIPGLGKKQIEMAKVVLNGFVQGIEDSKGIVLALEFRPEGLNLRAQIRFADETQSADFLKPETPTALADIAKLPRGLSSYGGSKFSKKFHDLTKKFAQEFLAADDDEKGAEQIEKMLNEIAAAGPEGDVSASTMPDLSINVTAYKNPERAATAFAKLYEGMAAGGKFSSIVMKDKPKITNKAQSHRGFTFSEVRMSFDFEASVANLPEPVRETTLSQFKRLMNEKTTFWFGTDGKVVAQITAKDWDAAKKVLDDYIDGKATIGGDDGFKTTRKNLPETATLLYLTETGQMIAMLVEQAKAVGQAIPGGGFPAIGAVKPVKGNPTYVGIALTLKPRVATFDLFVPGAGMNVAAKMLAPLFRNVE